MTLKTHLVLPTIALLSFSSSGVAETQIIEERPFSFESDFSEATSLEGWFATEPTMWELADTDSAQGQALKLGGQSGTYKPPFRSPFSVLLLKDSVVGDFTLTAKVKTLQTSRGHRDMCIFWGWQDPSNFYYVHLGEKVDPNSSQIFIVNENPRTPITKDNNAGIPWKDETWHHVKVVRDVSAGTIEVYFDDMETPVKTAKDKTFRWGMIGLGSFDDFGLWDDVKIDGVAIINKEGTLPDPNRVGETVQEVQKKKKKKSAY